MFRGTSSITALATVTILASASGAVAQIVVPTKQHETLDVELQSLRDNITLFMGDPQQLLLMKIRPESIKPRVDYASQAQAVLRIQDSFLFQDSASGAGGATGTPDTQTWEIRLCPSGPTKFALQCDQGESSFDFTDFQVRGVDIRADGTRLEVGFSRPNPVTLEAFNARVTQGSFQFRGMIDARAKAIALYVPKTSCRFEITGKAFEGESAITFQGVPSEIELVVSRKVGVRVSGPASTIAKFEAAHMARTGEEWLSQGYEKAKCRMWLTFSEETPALEVNWE